MKLHLIFLTLVSLSINTIVKGQATACFTLDHPKGCAPHTVNATDCSVNAIGGVFYTYAGGAPSPLTTHTYTGAGSFNVVQTAVSGGGLPDDVSSPVAVTIINAVRPNITVKTCSSRRVDVTINDNTYDFYDIDYNDGTVLTVGPNATSSHIYPDNTTRNITVTGKFSTGNVCTNSQTAPIAVTPIDVLPAPDMTFLEVTREGVANGEIQVEFNPSTYPTYRYDLKSGVNYATDPYVNVGINPSIFNLSGNTITLRTLNTLNEYHCLRIRAIDACTNSALASNEICSIRSFNIQAQNLQNQLTWSNYPNLPNVSNTSIEVGGNLLANGASSPYTHTSVTCATQYCYQVRTELTTLSSNGPQYSLSARKCVTAISTTVPPAVTNLNSTVLSNDGIQVRFDAPVGVTVNRYRIFDTSSGQEVSSGTSTTASFSGYLGACYKVIYQDNCNNNSLESNTSCTVYLTASLAEDGSIALSWTPYSGYTLTGINSYDILLMDENNQVLKTIAGGSGLSTFDIPDENAGRLFYIIRVNSGGPENLISYSNKVEISLSPVVYVPDAFTPNEDGSNDVFDIKSRFVKSIEMSIYNRWGDPVFHTTELRKGWDGKINGADAPVGTYAYVITTESNKGEVTTTRGTVSLIR